MSAQKGEKKKRGRKTEADVGVKEKRSQHFWGQFKERLLCVFFSQKYCLISLYSDIFSCLKLYAAAMFAKRPRLVTLDCLLQKITIISIQSDTKWSTQFSEKKGSFKKLPCHSKNQVEHNKRNVSAPHSGLLALLFGTLCVSVRDQYCPHTDTVRETGAVGKSWQRTQGATTTQWLCLVYVSALVLLNYRLHFLYMTHIIITDG